MDLIGRQNCDRSNLFCNICTNKMRLRTFKFCLRICIVLYLLGVCYILVLRPAYLVLFNFKSGNRSIFQHPSGISKQFAKIHILDQVKNKSEQHDLKRSFDNKGANHFKNETSALESKVLWSRSNLKILQQIFDETWTTADQRNTKSRKTKDCDCSAMFNNDTREILRAKTLTRIYISSPQDYIKLTGNCSSFIQERGYITDPLTQVEEEFPIAFSIIMYTAIEQSERLLRAIYRPQNLYCIHVDSKTDQSIYDAMTSIANCFDNVFIASKRFDVQWGTMTVLEPELHCMSELYNRSKSWKYFINLTGQEFPLRTNYELVQILKAYNGANDIDGTVKRANKRRWKNAGNPPHNIRPTKGSVHIVASREYVEFVLHDPRAKDLLEWCRKVDVPDETYFSSLQHNPHLGVPGSYNGEPETFSTDYNATSNKKVFVARFKSWSIGKIFRWPCRGKIVHNICIFGVRDLPLLAARKELFLNKLHYEFQPMTFDCLEELHFNHTRDVFLGKLVFDARWYSNLNFVKNKVK